MASTSSTPVALNILKQRVPLLSSVAEASVDIRKACNGIKRMSSLGAASMVTGMDPKKTVAAAEAMAFEVLKSIGFDVEDERRLDAVLPMMMEATAVLLADAAYRASDEHLDPDALLKASKFGVGVLTEIAKSRAVAKMVEAPYPSDMDSVVALRLTAASAMSHVAVEVTEFDFAHSAAECIKEAGATVVKAATEAATRLAPPASSASARLMLTQSLMTSAAKLYAASWRVVSQGEVARLDALTEPAREASLIAMEAEGIRNLLAPVNQRFTAVFGAITDAACALVPAAQSEEPRRQAATRPR